MLGAPEKKARTPKGARFVVLSVPGEGQGFEFFPGFLLCFESGPWVMM